MATFRRYNRNEDDVINSIPVKPQDFVVRFDVTPHSSVVGTSTSYASYTWSASTSVGTLAAMYYHDINTTLTFTASVVATGIAVTVSEYFWDFGDGTTATGNGATHTYRYANPSTIAHLRATDTQGRQVWSSMNLMLQAGASNPVIGGGGTILA